MFGLRDVSGRPASRSPAVVSEVVREASDQRVVRYRKKFVPKVPRHSQQLFARYLKALCMGSSLK